MAILKRVRADSIRYVVQVRDAEGQWFERKSFAIKVDAKAYESELIGLKRKGTKAKAKTLREYTLSDYWERWFKESNHVSDGWKISQRQMWRDHIEPVIGRKKIIEVRTADIQSVLTACKNKKRCGAQMQIHIFSMLHKMFEDAVEIYELFEANPVKKKLKPERPEVKREFLKPDDAFKFLTAVENDKMGVPIWIMTLVGLRIGEIQGLRRKCVDFDGNLILINEQWNSKVKQFTPPKNKRTITVPMPALLAEYLKPRIELYEPDAFVCQGKDGERLSYKTLHRVLKKLCKAAKLPELSPHELRHTCSEIWMRKGANQEDLRRLFNHKNPNSTKTYIHETSERLTKIAKGLVESAENTVSNTNVH